MREFDAHIYFTKTSKHTIEQLRNLMLEEISDKTIHIRPLVEYPIGPHPQPMFEVNFKKESLSKLILWLEKNRNGHSVLVHPVTDNELADHTTSAQWLGEALVLDLSKL